MNSYRTEGIILKRTNYGEADRILTVFTKHFGKISVIARGIRKISSKKGGNLELFNQVKISLAKGRNLDIVTEAEVINSFKDWRKNLKKVALAYRLCELVDKLTAERVESEEIYKILVNYLANLSSIKNLQLAINDFELSLLQYLGFWPKGKTVNIDLDAYVESLIDKKLSAKKFLAKVSQVE